MIYTTLAEQFDARGYIDEARGYLADYQAKELMSMPQSAAQVIERVSRENSINPRLLIALLETRCECVLGFPDGEFDHEYLMGVDNWRRAGLYRQLVWAMEQLAEGYYGWRAGSLTTLTFSDGSSLRLAPTLNAGTVALQYTLAQFYDPEEWEQALTAFAALHASMFGDPWERAAQIEPLYENDLEQPEMTLPFLPGHTWAFTGGPHPVWEKHNAPAALDFAPRNAAANCEVPGEWIVAAASGWVVHSEDGLVIQDLDGDHNPHTGWAVLYLHVAEEQRVATGTWLEAGDLLGHPSCEGGPATSVHLHIARKYNGEWMLAGGPLPFTLSGWVAGNGAEAYKGTLTKDGQTIRACLCATQDTYVTRPRQD